DPETVKDVTREATEGTTVTHQQHYSWTGGHLDADNPPTEQAPGPDWQANTESEPHAKGNGSKEIIWVNDSLHYTANSDGHAAWFYLGTTTETIPGQSEVSHLDYRYPVLVRTYTAATDPVVCDDPTDPTDPTDPAVPPVTPVTPATPATTPAEQPAVDAAVEAASAHVPSASNANGPSAQHANGAPQHVRQPEAVLPTAIDAGL
ncbi:MAG TPA: hypothetical protein VFI19_07590, partial [Nocardioides sp.]|nr:hypothetical protein [Nocardioides sp.]